jgi:pimeloyl-ACP methyl ester carboxylesterase
LELRRLPKSLCWLLLTACLVTLASAQVASPTGQPNSPGQNSGSPPSVQAPKLATSKAPTAQTEPPPVPVETEIGTVEGAAFRIDVPENWNHGLVMYFHGYEPKPRLFQPHPPGRILQQVINRGYAVAQSGYSSGGWAVEEAARETESLRRYFAKKHGTPRETFVMGHSMGGLLTAMVLEQNPQPYAGGLALCGVLAPADLVMQRAFANRAAFDAFFPGTLPDVEHIPETFAMNDLPTITTVEKALDAKQAESALIRSLADIHTNRGLADVLVFNTFVVKDLRLKAGGNPFDNRNLIYTGTTDDNALNAKVKRYAADPQAARFLSSYYTPTGDLKRKLLALHTTYDPLVPAATAEFYDSATRRRGDGDLFVQQYVNRDGHCNITADQTGQAFDELVAWVHESKRPAPGLLPGSATEPPDQPHPNPPPAKGETPPKNVGKPQ